METDPILELLRPLTEKRWLLNNLFQLESGTWRASIRSGIATYGPRVVYEFGDGATPSQAVRDAMNKAGLGLGQGARPQVTRAIAEPTTARKKLEAKTGDALLKELGL